LRRGKCLSLVHQGPVGLLVITLLAGWRQWVGTNPSANQPTRNHPGSSPLAISIQCERGQKHCRGRGRVLPAFTRGVGLLHFSMPRTPGVSINSDKTNKKGRPYE